MNKKIPSLLLVLFLSLTLPAVCIHAEASSDLAGHYTIQGPCPNKEVYLYSDSISGYVDLDADGTGYLYLGENNQGEISSWTSEGNAFTMQAGISTITGSVTDGIMLMDMDGPILWLVKEGADPESVNPIQAADYVPVGEETEQTRALAGAYYIYGLEGGGSYYYLPGFPDENDNKIELKADGLAEFHSGENSTIFLWTSDGSNISWTDPYTGLLSPYPLSVREPGILAMEITDEEGTYSYIYALADADVSILNAQPLEE